MKVLLITLLLVGTAFAAVIQQKTRAEGPECPIKDPLEFEASNINTTAVTPIFELFEGSVQGGGVATGLSTLYYNIEINILTLTATFEARVSAAVAGDSYEATGVIDAQPFSSAVIPSGLVAAKGSFAGAIVNGQASGKATLFVNLITNRVSCRVLEIDTIVFDSLSLELGDVTVGDLNIDFTSWNAGIKENFDKEFASVGDVFIERVRTDIINEYLGEYTIAELIELINGPDDGSTSAPCETVTEASH